MENIEIKARYRDLKKGGDIARSMGAKYAGKHMQIDTYFRTKKGRLKLRETSIGKPCLIPYMRPSARGPKTCSYQLISVSDPGATKRIMSRILGVDAIVRKVRSIYLKGNVRIHLDKVAKLGNFLEFEAVIKRPSVGARKRARLELALLMRQFGVKPGHLVRHSYRELIKSGS